MRNQNAIPIQIRESNIELLRIVLMTMIVFGHFFVHGMGG